MDKHSYFNQKVERIVNGSHSLSGVIIEEDFKTKYPIQDFKGIMYRDNIVNRRKVEEALDVKDSEEGKDVKMEVKVKEEGPPEEEYVETAKEEVLDVKYDVVIKEEMGIKKEVKVKEEGPPKDKCVKTAMDEELDVKNNVAIKKEMTVKMEVKVKKENIKQEEYVMNGNITVKEELNKKFKEESDVKEEEDDAELLTEVKQEMDEEDDEEFAEGLKTGEVLKCCICREICKRGVTTPCCGVAACRACATSKITATHTCWLEHCGRAGMKTEDLVNDIVLREAVDGFKKEGVVNEELARKIKDKRDQMNPVLIKVNEEEELCNTGKNNWGKQYACLKENCNEVFLSWGEVRKHMQKGCFLGTPKNYMNQSREKAENLLQSGDIDRPDQGKTPSNEEELVKAVKDYYASKPNLKRYKIHVLHHLRKTYGNRPFGSLGFGKFKEFAKRHGLLVTETEEGTLDSKDESMKIHVPKLFRGGKGKKRHKYLYANVVKSRWKRKEKKRGSYGAGGASAMAGGGWGDQEQGGHGGGWSGDGGYGGYGGSGSYGGGWGSHGGGIYGVQGQGGGWDGDAGYGQGGYGRGKMGRGGKWGRVRGAPYFY